MFDLKDYSRAHHALADASGLIMHFYRLLQWVRIVYLYIIIRV